MIKFWPVGLHNLLGGERSSQINYDGHRKRDAGNYVFWEPPNSSNKYRCHIFLLCEDVSVSSCIKGTDKCVVFIVFNQGMQN